MPESDLTRARREAAVLLGLDIARPLCPADSLRIDLVSTLRSVIDAAGESVLEGGTADIGRLVGAVEQLTRLLPPKTVEPVSHREDPRAALLKLILQMRERDGIPAEGLDERDDEIAALKAENERLRRAAGLPVTPIDVPTSDITPPGERAELHCGPPPPAPDDPPPPKPPVTIEATAGPAEDMDAVDIRYGFNNTTPEPWRAFSTDTDGVPLTVRGRKYWGVV